MSDSLNLNITNERDTTVYIYFSNTGNSITGTDSSGANLKISSSTGTDTAEAYPITGNGGTFSCSISQFGSGRVGFSLDELHDGNMKWFNNTDSVAGHGDYTKRYDKFELDVQSGLGNCDLTALDWIGLPFSLASDDSNSAVASGGWTTDFGTVVSNLANNAVVNDTTNTNGMAIVVGTDGVATKINSTGDTVNIVRVIGPNTATAAGDTPYNKIGGAVTALEGTADSIKVKGTGYDMTGSVTTSGEVSLTGTLNGNANQTLVIAAADLTSIQVYGANPQNVSVNGGTAGPPSGTVEAAVCRDVYAGFNLGAWGSATPITSGTFSGRTVGSLNSEELRTLGGSLSATDITKYFFSGAQPDNPSYYNQSAEIICQGSSNSIYGFPYSDYLGGQLISAGPGKTLTLKVLKD